MRKVKFRSLLIASSPSACRVEVKTDVMSLIMSVDHVSYSLRAPDSSSSVPSLSV